MLVLGGEIGCVGNPPLPPLETSSGSTGVIVTVDTMAETTMEGLDSSSESTSTGSTSNCELGVSGCSTSVDNIVPTGGDSDADTGTTGSVSPYAGSYSGTWTGGCLGLIHGPLTFHVSMDGALDGTLGNLPVGPMSGFVDNMGAITATIDVASPVGSCAIEGQFSVIVMGSATGTWSCPMWGCTGTWTSAPS